jgi:glycosyltransferase involved in cell wall biosynthesis
LLGGVATNQVRKELGLWAEVCAGLAERLRGEVRFWLHVDLEVRHWSVPALIADFALGELVEVTTPPCNDEWLASRYRQCACTFLPSAGEGFGYPLFESLACGAPVVHGAYGGGASVMSTCGLSHLLVEPREWRLEGMHNCVRPVYRADDFVSAIISVLDQRVDGAVDHLAWMKLGHQWKRWFREGL